MSLRDFIRANRVELDRIITLRRGPVGNQYYKCGCRDTGRLDDEERRLWVLNDEGLYRWFASTSGVTA